ncbi:hypothetical protein C8R47DRAFT_1203691 [Mycena vitilis]|nr:hypothetical protein C8R47DRAFT_1203691 [Mycena vitilis]
MNLDNTFKAAGKATVVDESKAHTKLMKGGILSILNERNEIISWASRIQKRSLSTFGSHHLSLVDAAAAIWNDLLPVSKANSSLVPLPRLKDVNSGERFGLVNSRNTDTFGGLYTIKAEPDDDLQLVDELNSEEQRDLMQELDLDPVSFLQPMPSTESSESTTTNFAADVLLSDNMTIIDVDVASGIASSSGSLPRGTKRKDGPDDTPGPPSLPQETSVVTPENGPDSKKQRIDPPLYSLFTRPASVASRVSTTPAPPHSRTLLSIADLDTPLAQPIRQPGLPKLTPSQQLFSKLTGINPRALKVGDGAEFYLLMNMRAEFQWKSFEMTPKRWVEATVEYNARLEAAAGKPGLEVVKKHPRALMEKLGEIEPKIIQRIANNNFKSAKGGTAFWSRHCNAVSFVKMETGSEGGSNGGSTLSNGKARKQQTCARCLTVKYPGPKDSAENHKKVYCSDGFKTKTVGDTAAPWPLPAGIFTKGAEFHPFAFLEQVREVYGRLVIDGVTLDDLSLEHDALMKLLGARFVVDPSSRAVMFKLFDDFTIPAADNVPDTLIVDYNGSRHLLVNCLKD